MFNEVDALLWVGQAGRWPTAAIEREMLSDHTDPSMPPAPSRGRRRHGCLRGGRPLVCVRHERFGRLPAAMIGYTPPMTTPARPAATVIILRDTEDGPEVLMLKRSGRAGFFPNAWSVPGGQVDEADGAAGT